VRGRARWVVKGIGFLGLAIAAMALLSLVVMSLWNWLVPSLFHGPAVQYLAGRGPVAARAGSVRGFARTGWVAWSLAPAHVA